MTAGDSGTLSGEIVVGSGLTMTVGTAATSSQGTVDALKVYDMFQPPSGGTNQRPAGKSGALFYNFDFKTIEFFDGNSWRQVDNVTRSGRGIIAVVLIHLNPMLVTLDLFKLSTLGNASFLVILQMSEHSSTAASSNSWINLVDQEILLTILQILLII